MNAFLHAVFARAVPEARRFMATPARLPRWARTAALLAGLAAVLAGTAIATESPEIDWKALRASPLALSLLLLAPALVLNALEFRLCGRAVGIVIGLRESLRVTNWSTIANLLPLPGGVVLRSVVLSRRGVPIASAGKILLLAGALWGAMAMALTAMAVSRAPVFQALAWSGLLGTGGIGVWIWRQHGGCIAAGFILVRIGLLALTIWRLSLCFVALGYNPGLDETAAYTSASVIGTLVGVVPAGLGVVEAAGAGLAAFMDKSPAVAFFALGLNRLLGLTGAAIVTAYFVARSAAPAVPEGTR